MASSWEQLESAIRGLSGPKDYGPLLQDVARQVRDDTRERFLNEVDPDGNAWPELAESTKAKKAREGYPQAKLVEVGHLWMSLGSVEEITSDSLEWGTSDPKAVFHDSDEPRSLIPKRQIVGFDEKAMQKIEDETADFVEQEVLRSLDGLT
ncbi:MAG: phage virion morphogenesis protein [Candidatus Omnitrophica bacterium]|nr:phage virion morphogenesis protein [Candidatus Omnitrophota bacterium]